jgi:hypothetical protein
MGCHCCLLFNLLVKEQMIPLIPFYNLTYTIHLFFDSMSGNLYNLLPNAFKDGSFHYMFQVNKIHYQIKNN